MSGMIDKYDTKLLVPALENLKESFSSKSILLSSTNIYRLLNSDSKVSQTEWDTIYRNKKNKSNSYKEKIHYDKFITPNYLYFVIKK